MLSGYTNEFMLAGRMFLGGAFVFAGLRNIHNRALVTQMMAARGVPQAGAVLWLGVVLQIFSGGLLITGIWATAAVVLLLLFLLVATPMFHNFWDYRGVDRGARINGFVSNVALAGGFLILLSHTV